MIENKNSESDLEKLKSFEFDLNFFKSDNSNEDYLYIEGIASDNLLDYQMDRIEPSCLYSMRDQIMTRDIVIYSKHKNMTWADEFGEVEDAKILVDKSGDEEVYKLWVKVKLDKDEPEVKKLEKKLKNGRKIGFSIGGKLVTAQMELVKYTDSKGIVQAQKIKRILEVTLDHICITKVPVNPRAWITNILKSLDGSDLADTSYELTEEEIQQLSEDNINIQKANEQSEHSEGDITSMDTNNVESSTESTEVSIEETELNDIAKSDEKETTMDFLKSQIADLSEQMKTLTSLINKSSEVEEVAPVVGEAALVEEVTPEVETVEEVEEVTPVVEVDNEINKSQNDYIDIIELQDMIKANITESIEKAMMPDMNVLECARTFCDQVSNIVRKNSFMFVDKEDMNNNNTVRNCVVDVMPDYAIVLTTILDSDYIVIDSDYWKVDVITTEDGTVSLRSDTKTAVEKKWIPCVDGDDMAKSENSPNTDDLAKSLNTENANIINTTEEVIEDKPTAKNIEKSMSNLEIAESLYSSVNNLNHNKKENIEKEFNNPQAYFDYLLLNPGKSIPKYNELFAKSLIF